MARIKDYSKINIDNFLCMTGELPFAVYIRLRDEKFTRVFHKGDTVDKVRFNTYAKKGVKELYIHISDRREYIAATERLVKRIISQDNISQADANRAVEEMTEQTLFEIHEDKVFDAHTVRRAESVVKHYVDLVKKDVRGLATFLNLSRDETYLCRHSIATSVFAIILAKAAANTSDKTLELIGMGALLHDLGMSKVPNQVNDADRKLSADEWRMVKQHPQWGVEMIGQIEGVSEEVKEVVTQHHENWDGSGYPKGLKREDIFYPARVVAIADSFSALTTRRAGRSLYSPQDAIALMQTESGKYDPKLLELFIALFASKSQAA